MYIAWWGDVGGFAYDDLVDAVRRSALLSGMANGKEQVTGRRHQRGLKLDGRPMTGRRWTFPVGIPAKQGELKSWQRDSAMLAGHRPGAVTADVRPPSSAAG
ncbi:hypothetical protein GCM10027184_24900 [Saccharothrix stipae]